MSQKSRARKREAAAQAEPGALTPVQVVRRRRNRRFLFVGLVALSFPILEAIAYQFRAITITIENRSDAPISGVMVTYNGGSFETPELKAGGSITRLTRPDFRFTADHFSTYTMSIRFSTAGGGLFRQSGRAGALDYSAHEIYSFEPGPPGGPIQLKHQTRLGFPLGAVRDVLARLGLG